MAKYRLKLKSLRFISPVDQPAQETAKVCLTKRGRGFKFTKGVEVVKVDEEMGLVFGWALTDRADGEEYFDLQGDNVVADDGLIKAAMEYAESGALSDEMHDGKPTGSCPFVMPMTPDVAKSFGIETDTTGLMVGMKPPADVFAKFKSGEYTGFSIEGEGEREAVKSAPIPAGAVLTDDAGNRYTLAPAPAAAPQPTTKQEPVMARKNEDGKPEDEKPEAIKMSPEEMMAKIAALEEALEAEKSKSTKAEDELEEEKKRASATPDYVGRDGVRYFKSIHGETVVALVKRADDAEAKTEAVELQKRAETVLKHLSGTIEKRAELLKAAEAIGDEAVAILKGADAAMAPYFSPVGHAVKANDEVIGDPYAELEKRAGEYASANKVTKAMAMDHLLTTPEGRELHTQYRAQKSAANAAR